MQPEVVETTVIHCCTLCAIRSCDEDGYNDECHRLLQPLIWPVILLQCSSYRKAPTLSVKRVVIGAALLGAVALALGFFWPFRRQPVALTLPGVVEIQEVRLGSKIGGRV